MKLSWIHRERFILTIAMAHCVEKYFPHFEGRKMYDMKQSLACNKLFSLQREKANSLLITNSK
jgi:hypothetical protein